MTEQKLVEFNFVITKASYDPISGKRRFRAVASDTEKDSYQEKMSLELFNDFIDRAAKNEQPPAQYRSSFWQGGMPYISVAHYFDLEGKGAAGVVTELFVHDSKLKAKGEFSDTPVGIAAFNAVKKSLGDNPFAEDDLQKKIRISIAFLDYGHQHGNYPPYYRKAGTNVRCPYCERGIGDVQYLRGLLIHLALTRVPVNERTDITGMEVDKSMGTIKTRQDDAASIIGDELASELEKESRLVGKSETTDDMVVVKSEEVVEDSKKKKVVDPKTDPNADPAEEIGEKVPDNEDAEKEPVDPKKKVPAKKSEVTMESLADGINDLYKMLAKPKGLPEKPAPAADTGMTDLTAQQEDANEAAMDAANMPMQNDPKLSDQSNADMTKYRQYMQTHPALMKSMMTFIDAFNAVLQQHQGEDALKHIQQPYTELGEAIRSCVNDMSKKSPKEMAAKSEGLTFDDIRRAMQEVVSPLSEKIGILEANLSAMKQASMVQQPSAAVVPVQAPHRALTGANLSPELRSTLQEPDQVDPSKPMSLRAIARRSAGLQ